MGTQNEISFGGTLSDGQSTLTRVRNSQASDAVTAHFLNGLRQQRPKNETGMPILKANTEEESAI